MATAPTLDLDPQPQIAANDIVATVTQNPGLVLLDSEKFDAFYTRMKAETDKLVPDTSTAAGRDEIRSMAARVIRSNASIDKARLDLTRQWRDQTKQANDAGKSIDERMRGLAAEVRKPLTDWEAAEAARIERNRAIVDRIKADAAISDDDTAASVEERGRAVHALTFDGDWTPAERTEAQDAQIATVKALVGARNMLAQRAADAAELERLRAEAAERDAKEAAERAERDRIAAEEQAQRDAQEAEAQRVKDEEAAAAREAERAAQAEEAAAEAAARAAERDRLQAEHDKQLQEERDAREASEREADELKAQQKREAEEAAKIAAQDAQRARNRVHVATVMGEAKAAIMTCGVDEPVAKAIVLAIKAGTIPHVGIAF